MSSPTAGAGAGGERRGGPATAFDAAIWLAQLVLAVIFCLIGVIHASAPIAALGSNMPWAQGAPGLLRCIGLCEILGALGLILPSVTRIRPRLTPIASAALALLMLLATGLHLWRGDFRMLFGTIPLGALAVFVAWARFGRAAIPSRA